MKKYLIVVVVIAALVVAFAVVLNASSEGKPAGEPQPKPSLTETKKDLSDDTFGAGTYRVGTDIPPGEYRTEGMPEDSDLPGCYWERMPDSSGDLTKVIANNFFTDAEIVTILRGEYVKFTGDCAWVKIN